MNSYLLLLLSSYSYLVHGLMEEERLEEYHARNYSWPLLHSGDPRYKEAVEAGINPTLYVPDTEGWAKIMDRRFEQIQSIEESNPRYNGWLSVMTSALVSPTFTESGWGLTKAPDFLVDELKKSLYDGLAKGPRLEQNVDVIEGDQPGSRPLFIDQNALNQRALEVLKPMHEAWINKHIESEEDKIELVGAIAYGLRIYREGSSLNMHVDKSGTHIISCILHVDHDDDEDSEPWPIIIEDFQGNTNEVILESGDMLFYESSKCLHGRPKTFKGKWYSSLFVHFYPSYWDKETKALESHYAVPPHWSESIPRRPHVEELVMVGTSMKEPDCDDKWCSKNVVWSGPAKEGKVISTNHPEGEDFTFDDSLHSQYRKEL